MSYPIRLCITLALAVLAAALAALLVPSHWRFPAATTAYILVGALFYWLLDCDADLTDDIDDLDQYL